MRQVRQINSPINQAGYSLVELTVVIVVMSILLAIIIDSTVGYIPRAHDNERANDIRVIARELERYYRTNAATLGPSYPPTSVGVNGLTSIINNSEISSVPGQTSTGMVIASTNASQTPTMSQYIYQPLTSSGALCTAAPCARFRLYYRNEVDSSIVAIDSTRQQ